MTVLTISFWVISGLLVFFLVVFGIARVLVHGHSPGVKLGYKVEFRRNEYLIKRISYLPEKWLAHSGDSFLGENLSPEKEIILIIEEVIDFFSFYRYSFNSGEKEKFYYDNQNKKKFSSKEEKWEDHFPLYDFASLRQAIVYGDKEVKKIRKENKRKRKEEEKRRREAERKRIENIHQKWKEVKRS